MQINAAQLSTFYASQSEKQKTSREPVTIDVKQFKVEDNIAQSSSVAYPSNKNRGFNDAEQAQFIRSFSANNNARPDNNSQIKQPAKFIQQYSQISAISNTTTQKIFDETV